LPPPPAACSDTQPDLFISKRHVGQFVAGVNATYNIGLFNYGKASSGAITVTDTLPTGLTFRLRDRHDVDLLGDGADRHMYHHGVRCRGRRVPERHYADRHTTCDRRACRDERCGGVGWRRLRRDEQHDCRHHARHGCDSRADALAMAIHHPGPATGGRGRRRAAVVVFGLSEKWIAALDHAEQHDDHRNDQEDVDEASQGVRRDDSEQP
jgi:uncharacterized repeat protein (TIGR01451 family)